MLVHQDRRERDTSPQRYEDKLIRTLISETTSWNMAFSD